jgi:hypothetical protein
MIAKNQVLVAERAGLAAQVQTLREALEAAETPLRDSVSRCREIAGPVCCNGKEDALRCNHGDALRKCLAALAATSGEPPHEEGK